MGMPISSRMTGKASTQPMPSARSAPKKWEAALSSFGLPKELAMAIGSLAMYHKLGDVISANWLGKAATGVFFVVCVLLVLFPAIPRPWATGLISVALAMTIAAFLSYLFQYMKLLR